MTFGSLFAGIGGFDLGLERAGMTCRWQVEIEPYCRNVLAKHWPDVTRWDDVRTFPPEEGDWDVDCIVGGDPCQENSNARKRGNCTQPSLGGEFVRIVNALRPRVVVRENPSAVRRDAPWPWRRFRSELESLGYACLPFRLRACCFGAEHQRDRLFVLGALPDSHTNRLQRDVLEKMACAATGANRVRPFYRRVGWRPTPRLSRTGDGVPRKMDRNGALGNAVVPHVSEWIGRRIMEVMS